jgi:hypothetical protein
MSESDWTHIEHILAGLGVFIAWMTFTYLYWRE